MTSGDMWERRPISATSTYNRKKNAMMERSLFFGSVIREKVIARRISRMHTEKFKKPEYQQASLMRGQKDQNQQSR